MFFQRVEYFINHNYMNTVADQNRANEANSITQRNESEVQLTRTQLQVYQCTSLANKFPTGF